MGKIKGLYIKLMNWWIFNHMKIYRRTLQFACLIAILVGIVGVMWTGSFLWAIASFAGLIIGVQVMEAE